jgi:hypothetical protein
VEFEGNPVGEIGVDGVFAVYTGEVTGKMSYADIQAIDTKKNKERWLEAHRKTGIIVVTCRKTKIARPTIYKWLAEDPEFAAAKAEAEQEAVELLEAEARRRAEKGVLKPVFYKGERCGSIREYSDSLMMFIIKAKKPEYRDRVTNEIVGADGKPIQNDVNINIKVVKHDGH